jgi:hypothetical protein
LIQTFEPVTYKSTNVDTRRAALVPDRQHPFQVREGKPNNERRWISSTRSTVAAEYCRYPAAVLVTRGRSPCLS